MSSTVPDCSHGNWSVFRTVERLIHLCGDDYTLITFQWTLSCQSRAINVTTSKITPAIMVNQISEYISFGWISSFNAIVECEIYSLVFVKPSNYLRFFILQAGKTLLNAWVWFNLCKCITAEGLSPEQGQQITWESANGHTWWRRVIWPGPQTPSQCNEVWTIRCRINQKLCSSR